MFHNRITPVNNENTRGHNTGHTRGFLKLFYFCHLADEDHGQKVDGTGEKEDRKVKHALKDIPERNNIGQRKQERRADIDAHEKPHDNGVTVVYFRGKAQVLFLFGKASDVQEHNDGNEDQGQVCDQGQIRGFQLLSEKTEYEPEGDVT